MTPSLDMLPRLRVLILDFDGVILESNDVKTEAFERVFSQFPEHTEAMMAFHRDNVSITRFKKFDHLLKLMDRPDDQELRAHLAATFSRLVFERMRGVPLVPGAASFLQTVTQSLPVYLASVTPAEELAEILQHRELDRWFRGVYGCPPWIKSKAILDVLDREQVIPEEAMLIGDSAGDQRAALDTGVRFLARDSGLSFDEPLPQRFPDMNQLMNEFERYLA
jgi:phosphoglycolate phosphatase-like HAD superfamily hydrolase